MPATHVKVGITIRIAIAIEWLQFDAGSFTKKVRRN